MIMLQANKASLTLIVLLLAAFLSACGSGGTNTTGAERNGTGDAASGQTAGSARVVQTEKGEIIIPANPKRVVTAYFHGTLLALGIHPIGANKQWWMGSPFLQEQEKTMEDIGAPVSIEKVLALNPDLIVINDFAVESYDQLSQIAPTVYIPYKAYKNVREEVKLLGDMFDRQKEADAWMASYEQKAKESRDKLNGVIQEGQTAVILNMRGKTTAILGDNYGRGGEVIYNMLKLKAPEPVQRDVIDSGAQIKEISIEALSSYAKADYIFVCINEGTTEEQAKALLDNPIWRSLPAVQQNQVYMLEYKSFLHYDPISILGQADLITDMLLKGVKK